MPFPLGDRDLVQRLRSCSDGIKSTEETILRWVEMDRALGSRNGLHIESFADEWSINSRTVRLDRMAFARVGFGSRKEPLKADSPRKGNPWVWRYKKAGVYLFAVNQAAREKVDTDAIRYAKRLVQQAANLAQW